MSDALTLNDIRTYNREVKNDSSGTCRLPVLAAVVPAKGGTGACWITKQGNRYYAKNYTEPLTKETRRWATQLQPTFPKFLKINKKICPASA